VSFSDRSVPSTPLNFSTSKHYFHGSKLFNTSGGDLERTGQLEPNQISCLPNSWQLSSPQPEVTKRHCISSSPTSTTDHPISSKFIHTCISISYRYVKYPLVLQLFPYPRNSWGQGKAPRRLVLLPSPSQLCCA